MKAIRKALTIAGSDSGAGAGIQADLKTFAALRVYGSSVVTAVTAQNTKRVTRVAALDPGLVAAQIDAVLDDIGTHAIKTGMLANAAIIKTVAQKVSEWHLKNIVIDPVMVATSGDLLIDERAISVLRTKLLPLATIVTPNIPEAERLTGLKLHNSSEIEKAGKLILDLGASAVLIKGGHGKGHATDFFFDGKQMIVLDAARIRTRNTHGTGCTLSAAIAAHLARGEKLERAARLAKDYVTKALTASYAIGAGHSPVHHFYRYWKAR